MSKKIISIVLVIAMMFCLGVSAFATAGIGEIEGSKTAEDLSEGTYKVTVSVPGVDTSVEASSRLYNEVIVMVDGSDSTGSSNFAKMKEAVKDIGAQLLTDDEHTHITLAGFGFCGTKVASYKTSAELAANIDSLDRNQFLYGPSITNCEGGFVWLNQYVSNSPNLNEAVVIYLSDGESNMDDEPWAWGDWNNHPEWGYSAADVAESGIYVQEQAAMNDDGLLPQTELLFPEESAAFYAAYESDKTSAETAAALEAVSNAVIEHPLEWMNAIWADAFQLHGMEYPSTDTFPASEFIHVAMEYIDTLNPSYQLEYTSDGIRMPDLFIGPIAKTLPLFVDYYYGTGVDEFGSRAADACDALGANSKVKAINLIGYHHKAGKYPVDHWMNPDSSVACRITTRKATFFDGANYSDAFDVLLDDVAATIVVTPVNNPVVTDPMSEWVNFDPDTLAITSGGEEIWNAAEGWLIPAADRPVSGDPISVANDPLTGRPVITWNIKEGALVITDRYSMTYNVTMNTKAEGYVPGTEYPLNDPTDVTYTDEDDQPVVIPIAVPDGKTPACTVEVNYYLEGSDTKLKDSFEADPAAKGSDYDVTAQHLDTIIGDDGNTYVLVRADGDEETGTLDTDKTVNLYYTVVVPYSGGTSGGTTNPPKDPDPELPGSTELPEVKDEPTTEIQPADEPADEPAGEPEEDLDIGNGQIPLAAASAPEEPEEIDLGALPVPLANVPRTGTSSLWAIAGLLAILMIPAAVLIGKKRGEE